MKPKKTIEEIRHYLSDTRHHAEWHCTMATTALLLLRDALGVSEFEIMHSQVCDDCAVMGPDFCGCGQFDDVPENDRATHIAKRRLIGLVRQLAQGTGAIEMVAQQAIIDLHGHTDQEPRERGLRLARRLTSAKKSKSKRAGGKS